MKNFKKITIGIELKRRKTFFKKILGKFLDKSGGLFHRLHDDFDAIHETYCKLLTYSKII